MNRGLAMSMVFTNSNTCVNLTCHFGCKALCAMTRESGILTHPPIPTVLQLCQLYGGKWATPQDSMCVLFRAAWKALYAGLFLQLCKLYRQVGDAARSPPHPFGLGSQVC